MSKTEDGGPAFPNTVRIDNEEFASLRGMTLRDYFAGRAMAAVWAKLDPDSVREISVTQTAVTAYRLADAMLKARGGA